MSPHCMFARCNFVRLALALTVTSVMLLASSAYGQSSEPATDAATTADNAAVREQLRRMEEQQKALLELVDRLQRSPDGTSGGTGIAAATVPGTTQGAE